jgi:tRNA isopentenyl-2-thiomethyl-A-37 hydroxylase MiaE
MKTFEIRVTQELQGFYVGFLTVEAKNKKEALKIIKSMGKEDIDSEVNWSHGDEYWGDESTIEIHKETLTETK